MLGHDDIEFSRNTQARKGCVGDQRQAFPCKVIDNGQNTEPPSIGECIADDVEAPPFVGPCGSAMGRRVPKARLRPPRLQTASFYSR